MRTLRTTSSPLSSARASLACLTFALLATAQTGCGGRTGLSPDPDESRSDGGLQDQSISLPDGDVPPDGGPEDLGAPDMDVVLPGTIRCRADMLVVAPRNARCSSKRSTARASKT
jgi:hypothetical protein